MFVTSKGWDSESEPCVFDLRGGGLLNLVHCFCINTSMSMSQMTNINYISLVVNDLTSRNANIYMYINDHLKKAHLSFGGLGFMTQTWPSFSDRVISLKTSCSGDGCSLPETCSATRLSISLAQFQKAQRNAKHVSNVLSRPAKTEQSWLLTNSSLELLECATGLKMWS